MQGDFFFFFILFCTTAAETTTITTKDVQHIYGFVTHAWHHRKQKRWYFSIVKVQNKHTQKANKETFHIHNLLNEINILYSDFFILHTNTYASFSFNDNVLAELVITVWDYRHWWWFLLFFVTNFVTCLVASIWNVSVAVTNCWTLFFCWCWWRYLFGFFISFLVGLFKVFFFYYFALKIHCKFNVQSIWWIFR